MTDWDTAIHHEHWNQLLSGLMQAATKVQCGLMFQVVEFLVTLLGRYLKIRVVDVKQYSKAAIGCLFSEAGEMTKDWLQLCKHCGYTWLSLCTACNPAIVPILLSVSAKLQVALTQKLSEQVKSPPVQASICVLMLVILHSVGAVYGMQGLLAFVYACCIEVKKSNLYPDLFMYARWDSLFDVPPILFRKGDVRAFAAVTTKIELSQVPVRMSFEDLSLSKEGNLSSLRESLDPLETIQSDYSDFSPGRSEEILVEIGEDESEERRRLRESGSSWWMR